MRNKETGLQVRRERGRSGCRRATESSHSPHHLAAQGHKGNAREGTTKLVWRLTPGYRDFIGRSAGGKTSRSVSEK